MQPARLPHHADQRDRFHLSPESMQLAARLDAAEAAIHREDYRAARQVLHRAPSLLQGTGDGRVLELMALCALHGPIYGPQDTLNLWQRSLAAFETAHDGGGMQRAAQGLGQEALARGELMTAARVLRQAVHLAQQQDRPGAYLVGLCSQAEASMAQGAEGVHQALEWAHTAVALSPCDGASLHHTRARLLRARAACLLGDASLSALDLLWAERAMPPGAACDDDVLALTVSRARCLLLLGHPRRAATCLQQARAWADRSKKEDGVAHFRAVLAEALMHDQPHEAHQLALWAQRAFAQRRHHYHRWATEMVLVRTANRLELPEAQARLEALAAARLDRWPMLAYARQHTQQWVRSPHYQPLGAVRTPWMRAVGKIDPTRGTRQDDAARDASLAETGFLERLQHAWAGDHHAASKSSRPH